MADDAARSRLGRGLASLIGDVGAESQSNERVSRSQRKVPIEHVRANPRNPRKLFSDAELSELSASIRERGIIQPILVRTARGSLDNFEIIAGERRWRAAQRAGQHEVPIVLPLARACSWPSASTWRTLRPFSTMSRAAASGSG